MRPIIFLLTLIILSGCVTKKIGSIHTEYRDNNFRVDYFLYYVKKKKTIVEASINGSYYSGELFSIRNNRQVDASYIIRLENNQRNSFECFVRQSGRKLVRIGGRGICYSNGRIAFDISIKPATKYNNFFMKINSR